MDKKKLIVLHHCDGIGGAGISLLNVYNMLREQYDATVYVPHRDSEIAHLYRENGVKLGAFNEAIGMISTYSGGPKTLTRTYARNLLNIRKSKSILRSILEKEKPDIVAVNSMTLAWAGKTIKDSGAKSICFIRETFIENLSMYYIKHLLDKWFDCAIFISQYDLGIFQLKSKIVGVVHDCVQEDYSTNITREEACEYLNIGHRCFNVLFVGGTDELKGWSVIKAAMEQIDDPQVQLIVAGARDNEKAGQTTTDSNIVFIGLRDDMPMVYKACDVLVFPSIAPHQARPVFEAGIFGLPVIISDFEETREFVRDGENGLTFTAQDPIELVKKIKLLVENTNLRERLKENNFQQAKRNHEFDKCKAKLLKLTGLLTLLHM